MPTQGEERGELLKITPLPWAIDRGSIWEKENQPRKGHSVASVETAFSSIGIRALPDHMACPSKEKLDAIGEANAAYIVRACNAYPALMKFLKENHDQCSECEGTGKVYNNADPTSGQWVECEYAALLAELAKGGK